ncbi:MAG: hypothetical protein ACKPKO_42380 [Candidatus Fonsibacter sp.]
MAIAHATASMRKCHSAWNRCKRAWETGRTLSQGNENTEGCKPERDLLAFIQQGSENNLEIKKLEQLVLQGVKLTPQQISEAAAMCTTQNDLMKAGNKKASGLKFLMKMV